jgi:hypothetical protein
VGEVCVVEACADLGLAQRQALEVPVHLEPADRALVEAQTLSRPPWFGAHRRSSSRAVADARCGWHEVRDRPLAAAGGGADGLRGLRA